MPSTFSQNLRIELPASGEQTGVWGNTTNNNLGDLIEQAISGATDLNVTSGDITLTALNGVVDQARSAVLSVTGAAGVTRTVTIPNVSKAYTVKNRSDATVNLKTASGTAFEIPTLSEAYVYCDGDDVITGRFITDGAQNTLLDTQTPFNDVALTGTPTAPTASAGNNSTQIATTAFVQTALPVGSVIMWYGSLGTIPTGWQACDGTNGTPDLRDRFVVGAGTDYALGDTGGANSVTLTEAQIPSHTHTGASNTVNLSHNHTFSGTTGEAGGHNHSVNDPGHNHNVTTNAGSSQQVEGGDAGGGFKGIITSTTNTKLTGVSLNAVGNHAHSFSGTTSGMSANESHSHTVSIANTGGGESHENRPPYLAIYFIMRV